MPNLELSKNFDIIRSERGLAIKSKLEEINQDEAFWRTASSDQIADKILEILNTDADLRLEPRYCTSHTHRKAEAFLIQDLVSSIFNYYHSPSIQAARRRVAAEKPACFVVRHFSDTELISHLTEIDNPGCTHSMWR